MASAVKPPSVVVTVIVALPRPTPVTNPFASTVAIVSSLLPQLTEVSSAPEGSTSAVNCVVSLINIVSVVGPTITPVTGTSGSSPIIQSNKIDSCGLTPLESVTVTTTLYGLPASAPPCDVLDNGDSAAASNWAKE